MLVSSESFLAKLRVVGTTETRHSVWQRRRMQRVIQDLVSEWRDSRRLRLEPSIRCSVFRKHLESRPESDGCEQNSVWNASESLKITWCYFDYREDVQIALKCLSYWKHAKIRGAVRNQSLATAKNLKRKHCRSNRSSEIFIPIILHR